MARYVPQFTLLFTLLISTVALVSLPLAAEAQMFRCTGKDGKKYYGQTVPPQCAGLPLEQLNKQGGVVRRIEGQMTDEQRAAKDAEAKKKRDETEAAKEESRRNRALLATYTSEKDIDEARGRALKDNHLAVKEVEARIGKITQRQEQLNKDMEFYKGKNKPPAKLLEDIKNAEIDIAAQRNLLNVKKKEVDTINAKYDDDKKRYVELTRRK